MRLPSYGRVKCPKTGQMVDVRLDCHTHCLDFASNPKYKVCLFDMTLEDINKDVQRTYTKKQLDESDEEEGERW